MLILTPEHLPTPVHSYVIVQCLPISQLSYPLLF